MALGGNVFSNAARSIQTGAYKASYAEELAGQGTSKLVSEQVKKGKFSEVFSKAQGFLSGRIGKVLLIAAGVFVFLKFVWPLFSKKAAKRRRAAYARSFVQKKRKAA